MWYHTLNVGFRTRISGETDFPCVSGERVGLGRSYVKLDGELNYAAGARASGRAALRRATGGATCSTSARTTSRWASAAASCGWRSRARCA